MTVIHATEGTLLEEYYRTHRSFKNEMFNDLAKAGCNAIDINPDPILVSLEDLQEISQEDLRALGFSETGSSNETQNSSA